MLSSDAPSGEKTHPVQLNHEQGKLPQTLSSFVSAQPMKQVLWSLQMHPCLVLLNGMSWWMGQLITRVGQLHDELLLSFLTPKSITLELGFITFDSKHRFESEADGCAEDRVGGIDHDSFLTHVNWCVRSLVHPFAHECKFSAQGIQKMPSKVRVFTKKVPIEELSQSYFCKIIKQTGKPASVNYHLAEWVAICWLSHVLITFDDLELSQLFASSCTEFSYFHSLVYIKISTNMFLKGSQY